MKLTRPPTQRRAGAPRPGPQLDDVGRSVRNERWRYTEWDGRRNGTALFDHELDPHETRSAAADGRHAATVARMNNRCARGLVK